MGRFELDLPYHISHNYHSSWRKPNKYKNVKTIRRYWDINLKNRNVFINSLVKFSREKRNIERFRIKTLTDNIWSSKPNDLHCFITFFVNFTRKDNLRTNLFTYLLYMCKCISGKSQCLCKYVFIPYMKSIYKNVFAKIVKS